MLKLAGRYGDIIFLPPEIKPSLNEARATVMKAAEKSGRKTKLSFAATSPSNIGGASDAEYDSKMYEQAVLEAENNGCEYFVLSSPHDRLLESTIDFARNIMQ